MADSSSSTPQSRKGPRPSERVPAGSQPRTPKVQIAIQSAAAELRRVDKQLAEVSRGLLETVDHRDRGFDRQMELREAIDCVRSDLLADAIETLSDVAMASEAELHRSYRERQRQLVATVM